MWFLKRSKRDTDEAVKAIHKQTSERLDKVTQSIDANTESMKRLNKELEKVNDAAYNWYRATKGGAGGKQR